MDSLRANQPKALVRSTIKLATRLPRDLPPIISGLGKASASSNPRYSCSSLATAGGGCRTPVAWIFVHIAKFK